MYGGWSVLGGVYGFGGLGFRPHFPGYLGFRPHFPGYLASCLISLGELDILDGNID
jgi:hypothetical protein